MMKSRYFVAIIFYLCTSSLASGVNHNALIISGYEAHVFLPNKPGTGSMTFNDLHYTRIWGNWLCWWTDPFLMWELLYFKECYSLQGSAPEYDHIWVFYGAAGEDYAQRRYLDMDRYNALQRYGIQQITDYPYYKDTIMTFLHKLAHGSEQVDSMTSEDNLFCLIESHGNWNGIHSYFRVEDGADSIWDYEFASSLANIHCGTKIIWMQPCHSGGFIDDLADTNTIIFTACADSEVAYKADDIPIWRPWYDPDNWKQYMVYDAEHDVYFSEDLQDTILQTHGEFSFHAMNAARGETPKGIPIRSDYNHDLLVSMSEIKQYVLKWDSWQYHGDPPHRPEHPQYSDIGNIGDNVFLGWNDYLAPDAPTGLQCDSVTFVESPEPADVSILAQPPYALVWLSWDPNTEADLVGYYIYRKEANGTWTWRGGSKSNSYCDIADIGKTYYYYVTAVDIAKNESDASNIITVYTYIPGYGGGFAANEQPTLNLTVRTNPVRDIAVIELNVPRSGDGILTLYNTMGERVRTIRCKVEPGHKVLKLDVTDLPAGVYFLKLIFGGERMFKKLTVFH